MPEMMDAVTPEEILLPEPQLAGALAVEQALHRRRSVRDFAGQPLTREQISQLLWAGQGITDPQGRRTAPSAGARYPLELYLVTAAGLYHYDPAEHAVRLHLHGDLRREICAASLDQEFLLQAPATLLFAAVYARTERRYGSERGRRYVYMDVGHAAQNVLLQAVAMGLGAVPVGAFEDDRLQQLLKLPADHQPVYLIPVGRHARAID